MATNRYKKIESQLKNLLTSEMYKEQFISLAMNVFLIKGLKSDYLDLSFINRELIYKGSIAWFYDDVLETILALPYTVMGRRDLYGNPVNIQVTGKNGYRRNLMRGQYVIMYDNMSKIPLIADILQYSSRIGQIQRTMDINIAQQKTQRFWKTKTENQKSIEDLIDKVDSCQEVITTFDNINLDETSCNLVPAQFVADKLSEQKEKIWNEFLRLIGVANQSFQKKERNIRDEIFISQAGTIASRYARFESRRIAIEKINELFGEFLPEKLEVEYYDGLPTTLVDNTFNNTYEEVTDDESMVMESDSLE